MFERKRFFTQYFMNDIPLITKKNITIMVYNYKITYKKKIYNSI